MPVDVVHLGFGDRAVAYQDGWDIQRRIHDEVVAGTRPDTLLLLEHTSVYTAGKRTNTWERPTDGTPVVDVDRGGKITWHGPGQLVGYPLLGLPDPIDVVAYVRRVEQMLIDLCADFGLATTRVEGRSGVWVPADERGPDRKVAAIGVRVARGVTMHGFAINADCDLAGVRRDRPLRHNRRRSNQPDSGASRAGNRCRPPHRPPRSPPHPFPKNDAFSRTGATNSAFILWTSTHRDDVMTVTPEGRKLLRLEVRNAQTPIERKPAWIKTKLRTGPQFREIKKLVQDEGLHTVCQEAGCPNIYECWEDREATFLIGGDQCTRRCDFCQIDTGKPEPLDRDEPRKVAESVRTMGLRYATVTGVARDDLPDEGAWLYAETVRQIHALNPDTGVELLIPDFSANDRLLAEVFDAAPEVLAHNVETVPRIFRRIRPAFRYERSLDVITAARDAGLVTKSNLILGMGETRDEVTDAIGDLVDAGCELLTVTQYLRPSLRHHPIDRWVTPEEFDEIGQEALDRGIVAVMSGPLVRSSYRAGRLYQQAIDARQRT